jgi:hypothetical protein
MSQEWIDRFGQEWVDRVGQEWIDRASPYTPNPPFVQPTLTPHVPVDITGNSSLLEGKPRQSTILKNLIDSINQIIQDELVDPTNDLDEQSSILTATGIWLDYIGDRLIYPRPKYSEEDFSEWFGFDGNGVGFDQNTFAPVSGPEKIGIDDDTYRSLLIVRGGQLLTDCSIPSLNATIQGAFGTGYYVDNGDMTLDVVFDDTLDVVTKSLIESGIITKPAGVKINIIYL